MKFIAKLRVWGNWGIGENVLKVFLRFRGSANRRVDLFLPLIASIPGRCRTVHRRDCTLWKPTRRQARPTQVEWPRPRRNETETPEKCGTRHGSMTGVSG